PREAAQLGEGLDGAGLGVAEAGGGGVLGGPRGGARILVERDDVTGPLRQREREPAVVREGIERLAARELPGARVVGALVEEAAGLGVLEDVHGEAGGALGVGDARGTAAGEDGLLARQPLVVAAAALV